MIDRTKGGARSASKTRPYATPVFTTYGSVRELTGGNSNAGSVDGGSGMLMIGSDPALKENIALVGRHPAGFGLYLFDYRPEHAARHGRGRQFGVMADEIERIVPEAVSRDRYGFRQVNYARLGITRH